MSASPLEAIEQLVEDLTRSGRWWGDAPRLSVGDFGYQAVTLIEADGDIAVNIPAGVEIRDAGVFGLPLTTGSDGVTEVLTVGDGRLEICCVGPNGRLLAPSTAEVQTRRARAATTARRAYLEGDRDAAVWAASRLDHLSVNRMHRFSSLLTASDLVGDAKAAATAGLPQEAWDEHASFVQAHVSGQDADHYWHALVSLHDDGVLPAPEALLIYCHRQWGAPRVDLLTQRFAVTASAVEGGLRELKVLGLIDWPAPLAVALETVPMTDVRSAFGPHGIKGQSRSVIITRALEALGESQVRSIADQMGVDLTQPALTERGRGFEMSYDSPDPRCERLRLLAQREVAAQPLSGLPDDFGRRSITIGWEDTSPIYRNDDEPLPEGDVADLQRMMGEVVDLAGRLLQQPVPSSAAILAVQSGAMTLIDRLGDLARRLNDQGESTT
jgi:hypothetical protein